MQIFNSFNELANGTNRLQSDMSVFNSPQTLRQFVRSYYDGHSRLDERQWDEQIAMKIQDELGSGYSESEIIKSLCDGGMSADEAEYLVAELATDYTENERTDNSIEGFQESWVGKIGMTRSTSRKKYDTVITHFEKKGNRWKRLDSEAQEMDGATYKKLIGSMERMGEQITEKPLADGKSLVTAISKDGQYKREIELEPFVQEYAYGTPTTRR